MRFKKYSKEAHQHACRALYKALLTHSAHLPLAPEKRTTAAFLVRQKFHKAVNLQGGPLRAALQSAYEDEALLRRACQNHGPSVQIVAGRILGMVSDQARKAALSRFPARVIVPPPPPPNPPKRKHKVVALSLSPREKSKRSAAVRRRPPTMGYTNGLPLLKRPGRKIPLVVSKIINDKIKRKVRQVDALNDVKGNISFYAEMEDVWDRQVEPLLDRDTFRPRVEPLWAEGAGLLLHAIRAQHHADERRVRDITKRFQQEIDTANLQYQEIRRARRAKRRARDMTKYTEQTESKLEELKHEWESAVSEYPNDL